MARLSFTQQLKVGKQLEEYLLEILGAEPVDMEQQRRGIDMVCSNGVTVEAKLDVRGAKSGNFFAELQTGNKPGCMFTSTADIIVICIGSPGNYPMFLTNSSRFSAAMITFNQKKLKTVTCRNPGGYSSKGMLVPFRLLKEFCVIVESESQFIEYVSDYSLRFRKAS